MTEQVVLASFTLFLRFPSLTSDTMEINGSSLLLLPLIVLSDPCLFLLLFLLFSYFLHYPPPPAPSLSVCVCVCWAGYGRPGDRRCVWSGPGHCGAAGAERSRCCDPGPPLLWWSRSGSHSGRPMCLRSRRCESKRNLPDTIDLAFQHRSIAITSQQTICNRFINVVHWDFIWLPNQNSYTYHDNIIIVNLSGRDNRAVKMWRISSLPAQHTAKC